MILCTLLVCKKIIRNLFLVMNPLKVPSALETVATNTVSLLTTDVKTEFSGDFEKFEHCSQSTNNGMWDKLLNSEEADKRLPGSILMTKMVMMQTEYMGIWKTKTALHRVPIDILDDDLVAFSPVETHQDVLSIISKMDIPTGDFNFHLTVTCKSFLVIYHVLLCYGRQNFFIVGESRTHC